MTHYSRLNMIVIDVPPAEHDREVAFWSAALGQQLKQGEHFPEYHGVALHGEEFGLLIQRLGDGPARVHLDIHTDDLAAEVARLEALGAERVEFVHAWWILRDPAGLLFCVVPEPAGSLNDDNAQRWE
jgi:catechol 2,3-dioxygenase-like lactoylglutathione lyase family enzyme